MTGYPVRLAIVCAALILGSYTLRLSLLHTRTFDPDEFQHAHAAWAVHEGLLPFRDFFEHHMPGIQFMLAPMLGRFHVGASSEDAIRFLFFARTLMWIFAGFSVAITVLLGARYGGPAVGWLSGGLLSTSLVFMSRTLEIRPDTPGLMFWLASLLALAIGVQRGSADGWRRWCFIAGGFSLGCGLVFNQKLLLAGPGLLSFGVLYVLHESTWRRRARILDLVGFAAASAAPLLALLVYFWRLGAAGDLVNGVLTTNLGWPREVSAGSTLHWMLLRDPLLMAVAVAGVVQAGFEMTHERRASLSMALLLFPTVSLLAGLFFIPTPYPQYMLLVLPAGAILGARFIWTLCRDLQTGGRLVRGGGAVESVIVAASGLGVTVIGLYVARPFFLHPAAYPVFGITAIAAAAILASRRKVEWAAAVLVCACFAYTAQQLRWMQGDSNADALREMRYVHAMTEPSDRVLDGFSGLSWFRLHASFYPFLHAGVRNHLSHQEAASIVGILANCDQRPKLVILDEHLIGLSPAVAPLVSRFYQPSPFNLIWVRKDQTCHGNRSERAERVFQ
jgi:hypothetical protein